ncbi:AraC family transcriptional regulator [Singulisphaera sp. Ch08]|uniref:AraC family transcriptional regulator n=1 Tax=Singulisphaera sp. Ch08 TaxID=3120278 RepID=A0AAU7C8R8_9BACT
METLVMRQEQPAAGEPLRPHVFRKQIPFEPSAESERLGWVALEAVRYRRASAFELVRPAMTHHALVMFHHTPDELEMWYAGVSRHQPPPAGSVAVVPAGRSYRCRMIGLRDSLNVFLDPGLVARVAASFDLDPARWDLPPLDFRAIPSLGAAMRAVDAELMSGAAGGRQAAESLANDLAVQLVRYVSESRRRQRRRDGEFPPAKLRAVVEYIEGHLETGPSLEQMAAFAHLSPAHFARQFKAATGLPPHQFVIARRVERAKGLLQRRGGLSLAALAARVGFADEAHLARHFKRLVGVTPGRFR